MTTSEAVFGQFVDPAEAPPPLSHMHVQLLPLDMIVQWGRCGQTADYIASYLAYHFRDFSRAMNVLSTVLNELIENAVKFSADKMQPIHLAALFFGDTLLLQSTNPIREDQDEAFREFVERLFSEDLDDLFVTQVEHSAENDTELSGLGLITLKNDYVSGMGMRFHSDGGARARQVAVQLHLSTEDPDLS